MFLFHCSALPPINRRANQIFNSSVLYFPLFIPRNRSKFRRNSAASFRSPLNGSGTFPRSPLGAGSAIVTSAGEFSGDSVGGLGGGGVGECGGGGGLGIGDESSLIGCGVNGSSSSSNDSGWGVSNLSLVEMIKGLNSGCTPACSGSLLASSNLRSVSDPVDSDADLLGALYPL